MASQVAEKLGSPSRDKRPLKASDLSPLTTNKEEP